MENNEDKRQMTPIQEAIHTFETLQEKSESIKDRLYLDGVIAVLESLLPKEENYIREIIDATWQEAYDDKQVPSTVTQDKIIKSVNETFKTK